MPAPSRPLPSGRSTRRLATAVAAPARASTSVATRFGGPLGSRDVGGLEQLEGLRIAGGQRGRRPQVRIARPARGPASRRWAVAAVAVPQGGPRQLRHARSGSGGPIDGAPAGGRCDRQLRSTPTTLGRGVGAARRIGRLDVEHVDVCARLRRPDLLVVVEGEEQREERAVALVVGEEPDGAGDRDHDRQPARQVDAEQLGGDVAAVERTDRQEVEDRPPQVLEGEEVDGTQRFSSPPDW